MKFSKVRGLKLDAEEDIVSLLKVDRLFGEVIVIDLGVIECVLVWFGSVRWCGIGMKERKFVPEKCKIYI